MRSVGGKMALLSTSGCPYRTSAVRTLLAGNEGIFYYSSKKSGHSSNKIFLQPSIVLVEDAFNLNELP